MKTLSFLFFTLLLISAAFGQSLAQERIAKKKPSSHRVSDWPGGFFGPFKINGKAPEGFENFSHILLGYKNQADDKNDNRDALLPDKDGNVLVSGKLVLDGDMTLKFKEVKLIEIGPVTEFYNGNMLTGYSRTKPITLNFKTEELDGISYTFEGEYLVDNEEEEDGQYISLKGVLSKYRYESKVAEAKLKFYRYGIE